LSDVVEEVALSIKNNYATNLRESHSKILP